jgi:hypothetical protein
MMAPPEIIPDHEAIDYLLGAVSHLIDASPDGALLFERRHLNFDPTRKLLVEIDLDDVVTIRLINGAPQ